MRAVSKRQPVEDCVAFVARQLVDGSRMHRGTGTQFPPDGVRVFPIGASGVQIDVAAEIEELTDEPRDRAGGVWISVIGRRSLRRPGGSTPVMLTASSLHKKTAASAQSFAVMAFPAGGWSPPAH